MKNVTKSKPLFVIQCYEDRQQTLPLRKADQASDVTNNNHVSSKRETTENPPPPPPMPTTNGHQNGDGKVMDNEKPVIKSVVADIVTNSNIRKNGTATRTPTPDYIKKTDSPSQTKSVKDEKAELESLESYKLKNPANILPKPPSNYFVKAPNGTATMKKHSRPVSVTIGEYAYGGGSRKEPTKLDFLNGEKPNGLRDSEDDVSITNRLQSELALTLSRSNLRKKTEALADTSR